MDLGDTDLGDFAEAAGNGWSPTLAHRAALLRCWRDDVETADLIDTAASLAHVGFAQPATLLRAIAGIEFGHPAALPRNRAGHDQPSAIDEALTLAARTADAVAKTVAAPEDTRDVAALILAVAEALADADGATRLATLLPRLDAALCDLPADVAREETDRLAATITARRMRAFLRRHRDLAFAPHGSAALLHAAARLQPGVLGPYCSNLDRLLRDDGDLIALIRAATGTASDTPIDTSALVRWLAILTVRLPAPRLRGIADLLGDLGLGAVALALLDIAIGRAGEALPDRGMFTTVRDVAIDLGDLPAAIAVQRRLADMVAHEDGELLVLADLEATRGAFDTAIALLVPLGDTAAVHPYAARLAALRAGRYERYEVLRGYASSPASRRRRAHHRHAAHG